MLGVHIFARSQIPCPSKLDPFCLLFSSVCMLGMANPSIRYCGPLLFSTGEVDLPTLHVDSMLAFGSV